MLVIQINCTLSGLIGDSITMSQILSNDTRPWFLLLGDLITITLALGSIVGSIVFVRSSSTGYLDMGGAQLCIVEQEGSLCRSHLFEGDSGLLSLTGRLDLDAGNLAAVLALESFR